MKPTSDRLCDAHFGAQLLLEIAQERSVEPILKKVVDHAVECMRFVISQVRLVEKGVLCAPKRSADTASCRFGSMESRSLVAYGCGATGPGEGVWL